MAVFGVQVVLSMIVASFLHKIAPYLSFGRGLIIYRLRRYQPPSDTLLRPHVSVPPSSGRGSGGHGGGGGSGGRKKHVNQRSPATNAESTVEDIRELLKLKNFSSGGLDQNLAVPKSANIKLQDVQVRSRDLTLLHFAGELEWMINLSVAAVVVYLITLAYYYIVPSAAHSEYNLSTIWLLLVSGYIISVLARLTKFYFSDDVASQRAVGIVFVMLFFVCSLGILLIDEGVLDFGLEKSHKDISTSLARLFGHLHNVTNTERDDSRVFPMWVFKICLALSATLLSTVLIFSGFRFGDVHFDAVRYSVQKKTFLRSILHLCYISPMFCLALWIRPFSHDVIADRDYINVFGITELSYDNFRFSLIISVFALRILMYSTYMQSFLDTARWRVTNLRHEQGRIAIKDLRSRVSSIFEYYPATGVHYLAPYLVLLLLTLLLHMSSVSLAAQSSIDPAKVAREEGAVNVFKFSGFGVSVFHGVISFHSWWLCFSISVTSAIGPIIREFL